MNGNRWSSRSTLLIVAFTIAACESDLKGPGQAGPPTTLTAIGGNGQEGQSGQLLGTALTVKAADAQGRAVPGAIVTFTVASGAGTLAAAQDTTDAEGTASTQWTMGGPIGTAQVTASIMGLQSLAVFTASVRAGPPAALVRSSGLVGSSAGGFEVADSVGVKVTDGFANPVSGATVAFAVTGGDGSVSHATKVTGADGIARTAWRLGASGSQTLRATSGSLQVEVTANAASCTEMEIPVGGVVTIAPATATCLVTTTTGPQKYIVAVSNSSALSSSTASFRLRGAGGGTVSALASTATMSSRTSDIGGTASRFAAESEQSLRAHSALLASNLDLIKRLAPARRTQASASRNLVQTLPLPNVGDIVPVKIPLNFGDLCGLSSAAKIGARVVYVGTRGVVLVDTATASNIAVNDDMYRKMGEEFDNTMYPILTTNYGNPLAMDAQTDQNGRVFMVFSKYVNEVQAGGIAGFVTSGDFFPTSQCPASNVGEYFYARVPTEAGSGFTENATSTFDEWHRASRTVVIHEVKHIASFAEKLASAVPLPSDYFSRNVWLEEGSAMLAEELWARTIFGYTQNGNTLHANSVYCEARPTGASCQPTKPIALLDHFYYLYEYVSDPEQTSVVGGTSAGPSTFYGSGWMFLRWVVDTYAPSESAFLTAMNLDMTAPGTDNMTARTGRPFADLLSEFAMAIALDDYPNLTVADSKYSLPSWNTRDMFMGLNTDYGTYFLKPVPLKTRTNTFGKFVVDIPSVHGGGFSIFEVAGSTTDKQLLEFRGQFNTGFPAEMRVKVARVQ